MKINKTFISILIVLVAGVGIGYLISKKPDVATIESRNPIPIGMHMMSGGMMMYDADHGSGHMMNMMVASEREFIEGMIPHHQEAVDTAREVIERGATTPEIKELVKNIVITQEKEIADMKMWFETWYGEQYADTDEYEPMMRELENLSGVEIDRAFIGDMIMHHMGAIMMARSVEPYIEHDEMSDLVKAIITTQSSEIIEMRKMLQEL